MIRALPNQWLRKFIVFLTLLFSAISNQDARASHVFASDLGYYELGGGKYAIRLTITRDCNGITFIADSLAFRSQNQFFIQYLDTHNFVSSKDITGVLKSCPIQSRCAPSGTFQYGFEELVYIDTVDLSGYSDCEWEISWEQCCRNGNITTGAANQNHYNYLWLNKCYSNSSPKFLYPVRPLLCYSQDVSINFAVVDTNDQGDSFSYSLVSALQGANNSTTYNGTFSPIRPMTFFGFPNHNLNLPAGFHFDNSSGIIRFRPTQVNQIGVVVVEVKEWKKVGGTWVLVSVSRRDQDLIVINCPNNVQPFIDSVAHVYEVCVKDTIEFEITTGDIDQADTTFIDWNAGLPFGTFTSTNGTEQHARGTFRWIPAQVAVSDKPYSFFIDVHDNYCQIAGLYSDVFYIYVRDSIDGANVDIGPDIIDSVGMDSLYLIGTLADYSGQPLLWTSSGDGMFTQEDSVWTYYIPGDSDRKTCSYELYLQVLDSTPCQGFSKLIDTLNVIQYLDSVYAGADIPVYFGDSVLLLPSVDTSRARSYAWRTLGDGLFGDTTFAFTYYKPGSSDWNQCEIKLELSVYGCRDGIDTISLIRTYDSIKAGNDIMGLNADSVQLNGQLSKKYAQKAYWRSTGTGRFSDTLDPNAWYIPDVQDWTNCGVQLIWQEFPENNCFVNADTLELKLVFSGLDAGQDQIIDILDSLVIQAMPQIGPANWGYWTTLGDGYFSGSSSNSTSYHPGVQDKSNCGTSLIWNYPYPLCSQEKDTISFTYGQTNADAGPDQSIEYGNDVQLSANLAFNGLAGGWWSTNGDGTFSDSTDKNSKYFPGTADWYNCNSQLIWHTEPGYCQVEDDTMLWTRIPRNADAGPDVSKYGPLFTGFKAVSFAPSSMKGWWQSLNDGTLNDSSSYTPEFLADSLSFYYCQGKLVWTTDSAKCIQWTDTVTWNRVKPFAYAGPDMVYSSMNQLLGLYNGSDPIWESSGTGTFNNARRRDAIYYPSQQDQLNCRVTLYLKNYYPASCFEVIDSMNLSFPVKPIKIEAVLFDSCYMDSLFIQLDTGNGGQYSLMSDGSEPIVSTSDPTQFYYKVSKADFDKGELTFVARRVGKCRTDSSVYTVDLGLVNRIRSAAGYYGPIKLYPNPSKDFITIEGFCPVVVYEATLFDLRGREIQSWKVNELPFKMNIESIAQENYMLRLRLHAGRVLWIPVRKRVE